MQQWCVWEERPNLSHGDYDRREPDQDEYQQPVVEVRRELVEPLRGHHGREVAAGQPVPARAEGKHQGRGLQAHGAGQDLVQAALAALPAHGVVVRKGA